MRFGWVTINVRDMKSSLSFYENIAGLKLKRKMNPIPGTEIAFLGFGEVETEVELIRNEKNNAPVYGKDLCIGFEVESLEQHIEVLRAKGIEIQGPFQPSPVIKFVYVNDPNGVKVQFFENVRK